MSRQVCSTDCADSRPALQAGREFAAPQQGGEPMHGKRFRDSMKGEGLGRLITTFNPFAKPARILQVSDLCTLRLHRELVDCA
jgi:hypothetical protein